MGEHIRYRAGYKYQLINDYALQVSIKPAFPVEAELFRLRTDGWLEIRHGYAWDGPSGPTFDTPDFMRGSLVHDVLYQMIREGYIERHWRDDADYELKRICLEDGMSEARANYVFWGVRVGGGTSIYGDGGKPLREAPCLPPGG
jgi:hypothetical protein